MAFGRGTEHNYWEGSKTVARIFLTQWGKACVCTYLKLLCFDPSFASFIKSPLAEKRSLSKGQQNNLLKKVKALLFLLETEKLFVF